MRRCGSAALDLCLVADGTYDGYWERRLHIWDVAAGSAIIWGAGGRSSNLVGARAEYATGHITASNGRIHSDLVLAIGA